MTNKNVLLNQLKNAFADYENQRTKRLYQRLVCKLLRYHNPDGKLNLPAEQMTQHHVDEFLAWMVRPGNYSRSYCNNAKRAIKVFFAHIGNPIEVMMVSTRHNQTIPEIITKAQAQAVFKNLRGVYKLAAQDFYNLESSAVVLSRYGNSRGNLRRQTLNEKINEAAQNAGLVAHVTTVTLQNSAIAHRLSEGLPVTDIATAAGVKPATVKNFWLRLNRSA